jgi:predicted AAA+ superfamily ATPase
VYTGGKASKSKGTGGYCMIFRRKIYDRLLRWKEERQGKTALLIEGARRVGKSTIVEEFARKEYKSYILIDFSLVSREVMDLFDDLTNLDFLFLSLQTIFHVDLYKRESLIVFDEVQFCPRARQAIKVLVKDHRYDYIETGSLISIRKNVQNILIPSEEERIEMFPMDYEEFSLAVNGSDCSLLRRFYDAGMALGQAHRNAMRDFRLYMLVGGMPQVVKEYIDSNNFRIVDEAKRGIIDLYEADLNKIDPGGSISRLFDSIPAQLSGKKTRYQITSVLPTRRASDIQTAGLISALEDSKTVLVAHQVYDPNVGLSNSVNLDYYKIYCGDTGLFTTLMFKDKTYTDNIIYRQLLTDKLPANLGFLYENVVAQTFAASGHKLYYHTWKDRQSGKPYEIDFLLADGKKICPVEVKSSGYKNHKSMDAFAKQFSSRISRKYLIYTKDYSRIQDLTCLPVYMAQFLADKHSDGGTWRADAGADKEIAGRADAGTDTEIAGQADAGTDQ